MYYIMLQERQGNLTKGKGEKIMTKRHSTMVGKSKIDNFIVTDNDMVTLTINKGDDLTDLIQLLEAARRDNRTTDIVRLWIKRDASGKSADVNVSNRFRVNAGI
jgi:hypothetical protein